MNADDVEVIARERCHSGFYRLDRLRLRHRRFDGSWSPEMVREVFVPYRAIAVLPYDPQRDEVVLVEQFRIGPYVAGRPPWLLEVVGGMLDQGETPEQVGRRETLEETGLEVRALERIAGFFPTPGGCSEYIDLFCGHVDAAAAGGLYGVAGEHEDIRAHVVPAEEAIAMAQRDGLDNAYSFIALFWLALNRDRLRRQWGDGG